MNLVQTFDGIELHSAKDVFSALAGTWELSRAIGEWKFRGRAVFCCQSDNELRYEENGVLSKEGNADISAFRRYIYRYEAGHIVIYFDEHPERVFQVLDPRRTQNGSWEAQAEHFCTPDHYASRYSFGVDTIVITHVVEGPRKNYEMVTNYRLVSRDVVFAK
jgi:Family of unknown function (DUF6314)